MGKKVNLHKQTTYHKRNILFSPLRKPHSKVHNSHSHQLSPTSKNSDTSLYFQPEEEAVPKLELRKAEALLMLSGSEAPQRIKFRQRQMEQIQDFIYNCQKGVKKGCRFLMITGAPGLGKTLAVTKVLQSVSCLVITLNANMTKSLRQIQKHIYEKISQKKMKKCLQTQQIIRELINGNHQQPVIVYIQQIETAFNTNQTEYTSEFLTLFSQKQLKICLIGVSNTIDALQRYNAKVFNLLEIRNLVFVPYSQQMLVTIIQEKIELLRQRFLIHLRIKSKLLNFIAKQLQAQTKGDLRLVNEFIKDLVAMVVRQANLQTPSENECNRQVIFDVKAADLSPVFMKIQNSKKQLIEYLPFSQQLLLIGIGTIIQRQELLYIGEDKILHEMNIAAQCVGLSISKSKVRQWLGQLESYSLIKLDERRDRETRITLNVNSNQITDCIRDSEKYVRFFAGASKNH